MLTVPPAAPNQMRGDGACTLKSTIVNVELVNAVAGPLHNLHAKGIRATAKPADVVTLMLEPVLPDTVAVSGTEQVFALAGPATGAIRWYA